ncbi:MAG: hypothetical protein ABIF09_02985 [Gemmatimonadota bacterium]
MHKDLRNGAVAGLLGGASIMILFLGYDAFSFGPLSTPDLLAEAITGQEILVLDFAAPLRVARIMMFTVLHLAVFSGLGIILTNLFRMTGARESLLLGGLYGLTVCTVLFSLVLHLSGTELLAQPQWPAVALGNFVAGVVMVGYLKVRTALFG